MTRPIDEEKAAELIRLGWTIPSIMKALDCSRGAVLQVRKRVGAAKPRVDVDDEAVEMLTRAGQSAAQIADKLKCSIRTVQRARVRTGVALPAPVMHRLTVEEIAEVEKLLAEGCCLREASRTMGRHPDALYKNKNFTGWRWSRREAADFAGFCSKMARAGARVSLRTNYDLPLV